jgi:FMN phosphatase YigB (HAD superfamily)
MNETLREIQGIIFELDSVLFDKADWVVPATEYAAGQMRLDPQRAVQLAHDYIAKHGGADPQIYNFILLGCGQFDTAMNIRAFTSLVNQFQPRSRSIQLYPGVEETLYRLRDQFKLAVVTDGAPDTQKRKVMALGLHELIPLIVYSDEIEGIKSRLPDPRPLLRATGDMRLRPEQALFVGHNPIKHFLRTREMGFLTVRVLSGEYGRMDYMSEDHRADFDLPSVARLPELLHVDVPYPENEAEEWGSSKGWETPTLATPSALPEWTPEDVPTGTSFEDAAFQALFQMTDPARLHPPPAPAAAPPAPPEAPPAVDVLGAPPAAVRPDPLAPPTLAAEPQPALPALAEEPAGAEPGMQPAEEPAAWTVNPLPTEPALAVAPESLAAATGPLGPPETEAMSAAPAEPYGQPLPPPEAEPAAAAGFAPTEVVDQEIVDQADPPQGDALAPQAFAAESEATPAPPAPEPAIEPPAQAAALEQSAASDVPATPDVLTPVAATAPPDPQPAPEPSSATPSVPASPAPTPPQPEAPPAWAVNLGLGAVVADPGPAPAAAPPPAEAAPPPAPAPEQQTPAWAVGLGADVNQPPAEPAVQTPPPSNGPAPAPLEPPSPVLSTASAPYSAPQRPSPPEKDDDPDRPVVLDFSTM